MKSVLLCTLYNHLKPVFPRWRRPYYSYLEMLGLARRLRDPNLLRAEKLVDGRAFADIWIADEAWRWMNNMSGTNGYRLYQHLHIGSVTSLPHVRSLVGRLL